MFQTNYATPPLGLSEVQDGFLRKRTYRLAAGVLLAVLYYFMGMLGNLLAFGFESVHVVWAGAGIAVGGLLLLGWRYWTAIFVADLLVSVSTDVHAIAAFGVAVGNVLEAIVAAGLYSLHAKRRRLFRSIRDVFFFLFAVLAGAIFASSIGVASHMLAGREFPGQWYDIWLAWWVGDVVSCLLVVPLLLALPGQPWKHWSWARIAEGIANLTLLIIVSLIVYTQGAVLRGLQFPYTFPLFPLVIWAVLRFEQLGAAIAVLLVSGFGLYGTLRGFGPFHGPEFNESLQYVQMYIFSLSIVATCLAASVTQSRNATTAANRLSDQLRALSKRLEDAREEERVHLSREIHDGLGQALTAVNLGVAAIIRKLPPDAEAARERAVSLGQTVDATHRLVQNLARELRPGLLHSLGLIDALEALMAEFRDNTSLKVTFSSSVEEPRLSHECAVSVFRIIQEGLTNVARHSQATSVSLEVFLNANNAHFVLTDDGIGLNASAPPREQSLGLVGMRERALICSASLEIDSASPDSVDRPGTRIHLTVPLTAGSDTV